MIGVLFWSSVIISLILSIVGIVRKRPTFIVGGAVLALPFIWYTSAAASGKLALLLILFHISAAFVLYRGIRWLAALLLVPLAGLATWLAVLVVSQ